VITTVAYRFAEGFDVDMIEQVSYAPVGEYIKDHCLFFDRGLWHLFSISGQIGHSWMDKGSEERISHSLSYDLIHWEMLGHPVRASGKTGYYDEHMAVAPFVIQKPNGQFCMFYSGWQHPNKQPHFNFEGHQQSIYMAVSDNLYEWKIPDEIAPKGIIVDGDDTIVGRDPHVIWDEIENRWLLYYTTQENLNDNIYNFIVGVAESSDLVRWRKLGRALNWNGDKKVFNPCESPFVLKHPYSGKFILFLNWDYSISDDPVKFFKIQRLPFPCGIDYHAGSVRDSGKGWSSVGVGFAREVIKHEGKNYLSGVMGYDGHTKLGFTCFMWTEDFLILQPNLSERNMDDVSRKNE